MSFTINSMFLPDGHRKRIQSFYHARENECISYIFEKMLFHDGAKTRIESQAHQMIERVRSSKTTMIELFMQEFKLSTDEGIALMCLAEALLRIPDDITVNELLKDKIATTNWEPYLGKSSPMFIHASAWAFALTGSILKDKKMDSYWLSILDSLVKRVSAPAIRAACRRGMELFGDDFVLAETIEKAAERNKKLYSGGSTPQRILHSYDMLGEAARTTEDSERYFKEYMHAIQVIGTVSSSSTDLYKKDSISIKLSALHPRYELMQYDRVMSELFPDVLKLCAHAKKMNISLCIDAEESYRLEISLMIFKSLIEHESLKGWNGLGLAVQAYQKRAPFVIDYLQDLAMNNGCIIPVRLVKGAYWDHEIKYAQENGHTDYPVYTRKIHTDMAYVFCAKKLLDGSKYFYPCFATHNAYTISSIIELISKGNYGFEFQRLHGMASSLYEYVLNEVMQSVSCRVYAPIGNKNDLLPYLIRRILENGANSSFVHKISDKSIDSKDLVSDPFELAKSHGFNSHPAIPLPVKIFGGLRPNSKGLNLNDSVALSDLYSSYAQFSKTDFVAYPIIDGKPISVGSGGTVFNPARPEVSIGTSFPTPDDEILRALASADSAFNSWSRANFSERAAILRKAADMLEQNMNKFMYLLVIEAGKVMPDAIAEVREAVDFLRYYAHMAEVLFESPSELPGVVGELNCMLFEGRGVFLCISPWNFPLAIFIGQIAAALVCGNSVLAKPSEQTTIVAYEAIKILHAAGVPNDVLHLILGSGKMVGSILVPDHRIAGIAFTGSTATACIINSMLAGRNAAIVPFIAETGGLNAMITDSSALAEQVTVDVINSAFKSAGQRCSALRMLFVQDDVFDRQVRMIRGAMNELIIGDPMSISTDIGPVIDFRSLNMLKDHISEMNNSANLLARTSMNSELSGFFMPPHMYELKNASELKGEVFGPILHIVRYSKSHINDVIDSINKSGYGLTFSVHSRINSLVNEVIQRVKVGNVYVNRNQIGAVVGSQPFGGRGLSGTGPKAGGPTYLYRFVAEKVVSVNTVAIGGDASLMSMEE